MITRIYIDNYSCFTNFEWTPGKVNLLVGDNGAGKSTVFDALDSLVSIAFSGMTAAAVFRDTRTAWDARPLQRLELEFTNDGTAYRYRLSVAHPADGGDPWIAGESLAIDGNEVYSLASEVVYAQDGLADVRVSARPAKSWLPMLEDAEWPFGVAFQAYLERFEEYAPVPHLIKAISESESPRLQVWGDNFASWYRHVATNDLKGASELSATLAEAMPGFEGLRFEGKGVRVLHTRWSCSSGSYDVPLGDVSDGQKALIVLWAALHFMAGKGYTLAFDEPDNYLAPSEIQPFLSALRDKVADGGQVFVISHNPETIDYLAADSAWVFWRDDGGPVRVRPLELPADDSGLKASEAVTRGWLVGG